MYLSSFTAGEICMLAVITGEIRILAVRTGKFRKLGVITREIRMLAVMNGEFRKLEVITSEIRKLPAITSEIRTLQLLNGESCMLVVVTGKFRLINFFHVLSKHKTYAKFQASRTCLSDEIMADEENSLHELSCIRLYFVLVLCQACSYSYMFNEVL